MKKHLSMMRVNPFQQEAEEEDKEDKNSDLKHYNHDSQVLEECLSLDEEFKDKSQIYDEEASESSNGNQTPTLHGGSHKEDSREIIPVEVNLSHHAFKLNSIDSIKHVRAEPGNDH